MNIFNFFKLQPKSYIAFNNGSGQPVIFIHGIATDSSCWNLTVSNLSEQQLRLVGLDLLGFGQSQKPNNNKYTLDDHAKAIEKTIKKLRLKEPPILVGHSLGGLICLRLAQRQKIAIKRLVLCGPPIYLNEDLSNSTSQYSKTTRAKNNAYFGLYRALAKRPGLSIKGARLVAAKFSDFRLDEQTWIPFKKSLLNSINSQNSFDDLVKTKLPTTIIYGKLDFFLVPLHYKQAAEINKQISIISYNGGHTLTEKFSIAVAKEVVNS